MCSSTKISMQKRDYCNYKILFMAIHAFGEIRFNRIGNNLTGVIRVSIFKITICFIIENALKSKIFTIIIVLNHWRIITVNSNSGKQNRFIGTVL